jgi:uncharacterized protein
MAMSAKTGETGLEELAAQIAAQRLPPVDTWQPARSGSIDIHICRDGTWMHEGALISRPAMVRLFSSILRKDAEGFWLVTPYEKLAITVDVAPFCAVAVSSQGQGASRRLGFRLNTDEAVIAGPAHQLWLEQGLPMLHVRSGLTALIARPVYYELAEIALAEQVDEGPIGLWSDGQFFVLDTFDNV